MTLTIFVWTHNQPSLLRQTLQTMYRYTDCHKHRVIVLANACSEKDLKEVVDICTETGADLNVSEQHDPNIATKELAYALDTDAFAYCHDDLGFVPNDRFWATMLEPLSDGRVACVGPVSNSSDGYQNYLRVEAPDFTKVHNIHVPIHAWRTNAYKEIGGHDLAAPENGREVDLCIRAHTAGFSLVVARKAYVNHRGGASMAKKVNIDMQEWIKILGEQLDNIMIQRHGVKTYFEYIGRSNEIAQVIIAHGYSHEAFVRALSRTPEAWP